MRSKKEMSKKSVEDMITKAVKVVKVQPKTTNCILLILEPQFASRAMRISIPVLVCSEKEVLELCHDGSGNVQDWRGVVSTVAKIVCWRLDGLDLYLYHHLQWQELESVCWNLFRVKRKLYK